MTEAEVADRIEKLTRIAHRLGQRLTLDDLLRAVERASTDGRGAGGTGKDGHGPDAGSDAGSRPRGLDRPR